jgi:hypothetical protein
MAAATASLGEYWEQMVTVALLGTDRREPPPPPDGALADLAADDPRATASQRLLQQVSACTVARRAGVLPAAAVPPVAAPGADPRPITPPPVTSTWHRLIDNWPVLEDEWMLAVVSTGHRLAPELVAPVLARHRNDAVRHARALAAAGPLGQWLIEWSPRLGCAAKVRGATEMVGELPELAIVPELMPVLWAAPDHAARAIASGLDAGSFTISHRAVLVNLVARMDRRSLPAVAHALDRVDPARDTIGLAFALADLARLRDQMLSQLEVA